MKSDRKKIKSSEKKVEKKAEKKKETSSSVSEKLIAFSDVMLLGQSILRDLSSQYCAGQMTFDLDLRKKLNDTFKGKADHVKPYVDKSLAMSELSEQNKKNLNDTLVKIIALISSDVLDQRIADLNSKLALANEYKMKADQQTKAIDALSVSEKPKFVEVNVAHLRHVEDVTNKLNRTLAELTKWRDIISHIYVCLEKDTYQPYPAAQSAKAPQQIKPEATAITTGPVKSGKK